MLKVRISCPVCGLPILARSLEGHLASQHELTGVVTLRLHPVNPYSHEPEPEQPEELKEPEEPKEPEPEPEQPEEPKEPEAEAVQEPDAVQEPELEAEPKTEPEIT